MNPDAIRIPLSQPLPYWLRRSLYGYHGPGFIRMTLFGYRFVAMDTTKHRPIFSDRTGRGSLRIGRFLFRVSPVGWPKPCPR